MSYAIVGVLAFRLALGEGGKATSRHGALSTLAHETSGKILLIALALGFAAYALWRLYETISPPEDDDGPVSWAKRAGTLARAAIYATLAYTAIKLVIDAGSASESQTREAHKATSHVLTWPAGRWLVAVAGACIVVAGLYNGYRAVTRKFQDDWRGGGESRKWGTRAGVVGLLARMVVFSLIGAFVIKAAVEYDPQEALGFDGALQKLAQQAYGHWLLGVTAAGLFAYALFCLVDARYRQF